MNFKMLKRALAIIVSCLMMFPAVTLADDLTDSPRLYHRDSGKYPVHGRLHV